MLLELTEVSLSDRLSHPIVINNNRLAHAKIIVVACIIVNNILAMSISNGSHCYRPSHLTHLDFICDLSYYTSLADPLILLDLSFVVVAKDVIAVGIILKSVVFKNFISAGSVVVSSIFSKFNCIGIVFNTLASTAEDLNEKEQGNSCDNEDPVVESEYHDVPFDVLNRDLHQGKFLPVQFLVMSLND